MRLKVWYPCLLTFLRKLKTFLWPPRAGIEPENSRTSIIYFLLYQYQIPPLRVQRASTPKQERTREREEKKGIEVQRAKLLTPALATDALIGNEEQTEIKKRNQERAYNPASRGQSIAAYGETIPLPPSPQGIYVCACSAAI